MGYIRLDEQPGEVYHYTHRKNLDSILRDGRIRRMGDRECWFCASLEDTLVGVFRSLPDDLFHCLLQNGINHRSCSGQVGKVFPPIIGKNSVFMPLSQNEDALVDPSTVFISIERLCSPAAILVRAIQKVLEFLVRQRNQPNCLTLKDVEASGLGRQLKFQPQNIILQSSVNNSGDWYAPH